MSSVLNLNKQKQRHNIFKNISGLVGQMEQVSKASAMQ